MSPLVCGNLYAKGDEAMKLKANGEKDSFVWDVKKIDVELGQAEFDGPDEYLTFSIMGHASNGFEIKLFGRELERGEENGRPVYEIDSMPIEVALRLRHKKKILKYLFKIL